MERYNKIVTNDFFKQMLLRLEELEANRIYCKHGLDHLLDVCRLSYIMALEEGSTLDKDVIYAAGLMHDLGRVLEMEEGISHEEGSVRLLKDILPACGYEKEEIFIIENAILCHRGFSEDGKSKTMEEQLARYLKKADKASRNCFICDASDSCKWPEDKKNKGVM